MADIRSNIIIYKEKIAHKLSGRSWIFALFLLAALFLTGTCHMQDWQRAGSSPVSRSVTPASRLIPEPDYESKAEIMAPGVQFTMPVKRSAKMTFTPIPPIKDAPKAALDALLRTENCANPVIVKWRGQWRGDCLNTRNRRIRIALVNGRAGWAGLRIDYADANNGGLAPYAKIILDSGVPAQ